MVKNRTMARNIFIAVVLSLSAFAIIGRGEMITALKKVGSIPLYIWFVGIALIATKWVVEALNFYILIRSKGYKPKFLSILKFSIASYLFHYITPFQSGGQAFQIYYLSLMSIPPGTATGIIVIKSLMFQIAIITALILSIPFMGFMVHLGINRFIWFAITLASLLILLYIFAASHHVWRSSISKKIRGILYTRYRKVYIKIARELMLFRQMWKTTPHYIIIIGSLISFIQISLFISPLIVVLHYLHPDIKIFRTFEMALISDIIGGLVPTPGGSGGVESVMALVLSALGIPRADVLLSVGIWRLLAYYMPIGAGMIALLLMGIDHPEDFIGQRHKKEEGPSVGKE